MHDVIWAGFAGWGDRVLVQLAVLSWRAWLRGSLGQRWVAVGWSDRDCSAGTRVNSNLGSRGAGAAQPLYKSTQRATVLNVPASQSLQRGEGRLNGSTPCDQVRP